MVSEKTGIFFIVFFFQINNLIDLAHHKYLIAFYKTSQLFFRIVVVNLENNKHDVSIIKVAYKLDFNLQSIWLSEIGYSSNPHGDPHVINLGCHVTQGQVAHHFLLRHLQLDHVTCSTGCPCNLDRGKICKNKHNINN